MTKTATRMRTSAGAEATLAFLRNLFFDYPRDFAVRLWDGTVWEPDDGRVARFTIVLRHPGAVRAMFLPPGELTISEAFVYDNFDVEGDLEAVFPLGDHLFPASPASPSASARCAACTRFRRGDGRASGDSARGSAAGAHRSSATGGPSRTTTTSPTSSSRSGSTRR